jgi:uncharacterized membrane protein
MEDRKVLAALLASALLGAIVGAAGAIVAGAPRAPETSGAAGSAALEQEVRALRLALADAAARFGEVAARERSDRMAAPASEPRERVGPSGADALLAGLDVRLARLAELLERPPSTQSAARLPGEHRGTPDFPAKEVVNSPEFRNRHLLWDYARVLERYGPPDHISANQGEVQWYYRSNEGPAVRIAFVGGLLYFMQGD